MDNHISCKYIGHATSIIKIGDNEFLTDPHFTKNTLFIKRRKDLPIDPAKLEDPQAVLISHVHFDHLDIDSYKYISCKVPIIVPEGSERAIGQYTSNPIIELGSFASYELPDGTKITAMPSAHPAFRVLPLRYSKTNSYLIKHPDIDEQVLFVGDSAYGSHFSQIGNLGNIGLAILPIGGYEPRWFMKSRHMTPAEAVQAFEDLGASHMIPIHHGVFRLSLESPDAPAEWIEKICSERIDLGDKIHTLEPGEEFSLK